MKKIKTKNKKDMNSNHLVHPWLGLNKSHLLLFHKTAFLMRFEYELFE